MTILIVPQIENAVHITDSNGKSLLKRLSNNNNIPGLRIKKDRITGKFYFDIEKNFELSKYEPLIKPLIPAEKFILLKAFIDPDSINTVDFDNIFNYIDTVFKKLQKKVPYFIKGDVYSIYTSPDKTYSIIKITRTAETCFTNYPKDHPQISIYFLHSRLSPESKIILQKLQEDDCIMVTGTLSFYEGQLQIQGTNIFSLVQSSKLILWKESQENQWKSLGKTHQKPFHPKNPNRQYTIAVITTDISQQGFEDFKNILNSKFYTITATYHRISLQNIDEIIQEIKNHNQKCDCDIIAIIRGGGNRYDLLPFQQFTTF